MSLMYNQYRAMFCSPPKAARYISGIFNSFGRVITVLIACCTTAKGFGGKKDYSNPEFRILMASSTGSPLRSMQISEGMKYGLMQGILEMASGHFLKGILKMIRGLLGRLGGQKTRLVLDQSSHFIFI